MFPISRDPPEGGTAHPLSTGGRYDIMFPISRDPPEGGTYQGTDYSQHTLRSFQFLGIPPKGELAVPYCDSRRDGCFQFLGIPPKGELMNKVMAVGRWEIRFPISRDPPEGGTILHLALSLYPPLPQVSNF